MNPRTPVHNHAFVTVFLGGGGAAASITHDELDRADGRPFLHTSLVIDTHDADPYSADDRCVISMTPDEIESMVTNAKLYGPTVEAIVETFRPLMNKPGDLIHGACTTRPLTQLFFRFHSDQICSALRDAVTRLRNRARINTVRFFFASTAGGGTGSALQVLLTMALASPQFRQKLLLGDGQYFILPPISLIVEPFHYARVVQETQAHKILANSYAFREEMEVLLQRGIGPDYVFHIGYSNDYGAVLNNKKIMASTLGASTYQIQRAWPQFKSYWVDSVDTNHSPYAAQDTLEDIYPFLFTDPQASPSS